MKQIPLSKALTILLLVSLTLTASCEQRAEKQRAEKQELILLNHFIEQGRMSPSETLKSLIDQPGTLLMAVPEGYRETPEWIRFIIPVLYNNGITELGVFFLSPEGGTLAEEVTTPGGWDEKKAERALYLADPSWGYAEYRDILAYTEHYNSLLNKDQPFFRLKPLYKDRTFHAATASSLAADQKKLVFIIPQRDLTGVHDLCGNGRFGDLSVLLLYGPVEHKNRMIIPWNGILEKAIRKIRTERIPCGVLLKDLPATSIFRPDKRITALLMVRPSRQFKAVTPIEDFVKREDHTDALARFPVKISPTPVFRSIQKMNGYIADRARFWKKGSAAAH